MLAFLISGVLGHSRLACPAPRSTDTGIKVGPCGDQTNNFSGPAMVIAPGPMTIVWEEAIGHIGAPFRISLSQENNDSLACVLLDHIPHNDESKPNYNDPSTYVPYRITLIIPDVACNKCSIQLANPMTDKIPNGTSCTDPGTCASVYHSCANVIITGSVPMDQIKCPVPSDWPPSVLVPGTYTQESALWVNSWLALFPASFTTPTGLCTEPTPTDDPSDDSTKVIAIAVSVSVAAVVFIGIVAYVVCRKRQLQTPMSGAGKPSGGYAMLHSSGQSS